MISAVADLAVADGADIDDPNGNPFIEAGE
jgi:hypothetical protein